MQWVEGEKHSAGHICLWLQIIKYLNINSGGGVGGCCCFFIIKYIICNKCASSPEAGQEQKQDQNTHERRGMKEMGKQEKKCLRTTFYNF